MLSACCIICAFLTQDAEATGTSQSSPGKRKGGEGGGDNAEGQTPNKKRRADLPTTLNSEISGHILATIPILSMKASMPLKLTMRVSNKKYLHNESTAEEVAWSAGSLLVAFGKGKFAHKEDTDMEKARFALVFLVGVWSGWLNLTRVTYATQRDILYTRMPTCVAHSYKVCDPWTSHTHTS